METTAGTSTTSFDEVDDLISILRAWGINYLVGLEHPADAPRFKTDQLPAVDLIQRLAQCHDYPRVRDACISLFLLHPELVGAAQQAMRESQSNVFEQIAVLILATLYLQRLWSIRLAMALGRFPGFPEQPFADLWKNRSLPAPACHNGMSGLIALQEAEQKRTGLPFTFTGDWQNQVDHLLLQEEAKHRPIKNLQPLFLLLEEAQRNEQESVMSMRQGVDKAAIESFLQQLGKTFRKLGRLYLVGGAALVHMGVRSGFTQDIDVQVSGADEGDLIVAIQRMIERMQINVEFASPVDFIPLPKQWEAHARFVGRYGMIDVFYFDFYSIALSKMERGNSRDIADVQLLVQQSIITLDELDNAYQEVLAQLGKGRYPRITPKRFTERYQAVRRLL
ncbi:MAG TPA: DUF6036 family nucleotidyltransferase [Ktedonobacteraceae bacterium]|nr:DUF6036 family nucleotidyltransferase [Ktedonobacteraceae bacterium]